MACCAAQRSSRRLLPSVSSSGRTGRRSTRVLLRRGTASRARDRWRAARTRPRWAGPIDDPPPVWKRLSDHGRRVASFDAPHARVADTLNGVQIVEWGCHDRHAGTRSFPPALVDEINDKYGPHPIGTVPHGPREHYAPCDFVHRAGEHRTAEENGALLETMRQAIAVKRAASVDLLTGDDWDLYFAVFGEGHCSGHQFWHVHDETHPWHDATRARAARRRSVARGLHRARRARRRAPRTARRRHDRLCAAEPRDAGALRRHAAPRSGAVASRRVRVGRARARGDVPRRRRRQRAVAARRAHRRVRRGGRPAAPAPGPRPARVLRGRDAVARAAAVVGADERHGVGLRPCEPRRSRTERPGRAPASSEPSCTGSPNGSASS